MPATLGNLSRLGTEDVSCGSTQKMLVVVVHYDAMPSSSITAKCEQSGVQVC